MTKIEIMQGDSYPLEFQLVFEQGTASLPRVVEIEVTFGGMRKTLTDGDVEFDSATGVCSMPLTQNETFAMSPGAHDFEVRVKSHDGNVIGEQRSSVYIRSANSEEVL